MKTLPEVDALQWMGTNVSPLAKWASELDLAHRKQNGGVLRQEILLPIDVIKEGNGFRLEIRTKAGVQAADVGDWVIFEEGEFRACKPAIFEEKYEAL
jgi:hypothetical protein